MKSCTCMDLWQFVEIHEITATARERSSFWQNFSSQYYITSRFSDSCYTAQMLPRHCAVSNFSVERDWDLGEFVRRPACYVQPIPSESTQVPQDPRMRSSELENNRIQGSEVTAFPAETFAKKGLQEVQFEGGLF